MLQATGWALTGNRFDNNTEEMNEIWALIADFEMTLRIRRQRKHAGHAFWNSFQLLNSNTMGYVTRGLGVD